MKVYISKQTMQLNDKRVVNSIAIILFLLLLSALTSVNAYQAGETFRDCETCPEMVVLPAGKFTMGSPEGERGRYDDEGPQYQVTIPKPFAVGKYEVTVGQYAEFIRETKHKTGNCLYVQDGSLRDDDDFNWRNPNFKQSNNHPVVCVSWDDASTYVHWLSVKTGHEYRLLTEAEWEYAARAGTTTPYHFGRMILGNQANYDRNNEGAVAVGSYPSNAFGLHDMQAMYGNGWGTVGTMIILVRRQTVMRGLADVMMLTYACCAAVFGAMNHGSCAPPFASWTLHLLGKTTLGFVLPGRLPHNSFNPYIRDFG